MRASSRALAPLLGFGIALIFPDACANELAEREAIRATVRKAMHEEAFATLEAQAAGYRESKARTSSGLWKLTLFYSAVNGYFHGDSRDVADQAYWDAIDQVAAGWLDAYPDSPTANLAFAEMLIRKGWRHRGAGYANTVKPEAWAPFHEHIEQARQHLEKHKARASADPHWYVLMAAVGKAQAWPEERFAKLIDEALDREPRFYQTYFSAIDYYAPKWHGSPLAIERFAMRALRRTKETEGFGLYARIYWSASQTQFDERLFSDSVVDWSRMKQGIDDVLKVYPDSWNINNFARFACLSRDKAKTAELIARINDEPIKNVWRNPSFEECRSWSSR